MLRAGPLWVALAVGGTLFLAPPALTQQTHTVEISGLKFTPPVARVHAGDTIVFINKDVVPHTVTQVPAGWDSGTLAKDKSWSQKAATPGSFDYFCRFHPNMKAKFLVE